jgi:hypothetical protein
MEQDLKYTINSLLQEQKDGTISGPMSPVLFAKEMAIQMDFKYNRIARVHFEDEEVHQYYDDILLTGHDTIIIGCQSKKDLWLSLYVDLGIGGIPVAMIYQSNKEVCMTGVYEHCKFARTLTLAEITAIFEFVFANPESIAIHEKENLIIKKNEL